MKENVRILRQGLKLLVKSICQCRADQLAYGLVTTPFVLTAF